MTKTEEEFAEKLDAAFEGVSQHDLKKLLASWDLNADEGHTESSLNQLKTRLKKQVESWPDVLKDVFKDLPINVEINDDDYVGRHEFFSFSHCILDDFDLSGADLSYVNLSYVELYRATLTGANLWGAELVDADLTDADLTDAKLDSAILCGTNLTDAKGLVDGDKNSSATDISHSSDTIPTILINKYTLLPNC
jgi:hypothetical protein